LIALASAADCGIAATLHNDGVRVQEKWMSVPRWFGFAFAFWCGVLLFPETGRSADVDVALVLAVDISNSMDPDEQALQREGYVEAFRSPLLHEAIRSGALGRVTVTYVEWAASHNQQIVVPWTEMEGAEDAISFAEQLTLAPIRRAPRTSISGAIDFSVRLLQERPGQAARRVIDISGDGANNQGRRVTDARDEAVAHGFIINGLPLLLKRRAASAYDVENLEEHYRDCVIGGLGSFMMPVRDRSEFTLAIKTKIIREIAGREPTPWLILAQVRPRTNCSAVMNPTWDSMPN
jgi:hypothetical protein